jgi:SAM-dependent methyltransferase
MNYKTLVKKLLPPFVLEQGEKILSHKMQQQYLEQGEIPWSKGYRLHKIALISQVLSNKRILDCFFNKSSLPPRYGYSLDERCVEYPWLLTRMLQLSGNFLDAGSALNFDFILEQFDFTQQKLHTLTLAPESNCFWQKGVSYLYADLRQVPIKDDFYDAIACLSTLEHVGMDNSSFTTETRYHENRPDDFVAAVQELRRVLKPGGSLFVSVPYGIYKHYGSFHQFDADLLRRMVDAFGPASMVDQSFYRYTAQGWEVASQDECANEAYVEWVAIGWKDGFPSTIPIEPDHAAAARAVACIHLIKS